MEEEKKAGILKNITGALMEPKATFEKVIEEPKIFRYLIPITLVQLIITVIELPKIISFVILNAQQTQNAAQMANPLVKNMVIISSLVSALFVPGIMILIITALTKLVTMLIKENGDFKQLFCVNTLAYIPILIGGLVGAIVISFTEPENLKNVTTSLAMVLSSSISETSVIYKLFSSIDLFYIWSLILISIGTSVVYKMKIKKSAFIIFGLYIVSIVIRIIV